MNFKLEVHDDKKERHQSFKACATLSDFEYDEAVPGTLDINGYGYDRRSACIELAEKIAKVQAHYRECLVMLDRALISVITELPTGGE